MHQTVNETLPRVTDIIAFSGLMPDYERWDPERKGIGKGTAVDVGCQLLFQGHKLEDLEVDPIILPYLVSLDLWLQHTGFKAEGVQQEGISIGLGFIGHWDVHGTMGNRRTFARWMIDAKAAVKAKWHKLQTAAYVHLARCQKIEIDHRGSLYLDEHGGMAKLDAHTDSSDWQCFFSALKLYQGEKEMEQYRENIRRWKEAA